MSLNKYLLWVGLLLSLASPSLAKSLYVNGATGNDNTTYANNNSDNPWATIGRAAWGSTNRAVPVSAQAATAGDTVYIAAGTYTASGTGARFQVLYNPVNSGTSESARIVFQGVGLVRLITTPVGGPIIGADGKNYITWDGFYIDDTESAHITGEDPMVMFHSQEYGTIQNSTLIHHTSIEGDSNFCAIGCYSTTGCRAYNNDISNVVGTDYNVAAIYTYASRYGIWENNNIYNSTAALSIKGSAEGITNDNNIFRKNKVWNVTTFGVRIGGTGGDLNRDNHIYQNVFMDSSSNATGILYTSSSSGSGNVFANNTLYDAGCAYNWKNTVSNEIVKYYNNIVHTAANCVAYNDNPEPPTYYDFEHNSYYSVPSGNGWINIGGSAYGSWATTWTGTWGQDNAAPASTNETDPLLANPTDNDFRLCTGSGVPDASCSGASPALTLGIDILDLDGDAATDDIIPAGAYITGNETIGVESSDTTPTAFTFTDQTGVALSSTNNSDNVTVAGIDNTTTLALTGDASCKYSINGAAWATAADNVALNDNVALQNTASGSYNTAVSCTLNLGGVTDTWSVTTLAAIADPVAPRFKGASMSGGWR